MARLGALREPVILAPRPACRMHFKNTIEACQKKKKVIVGGDIWRLFVEYPYCENNTTLHII